MNDEQVREKKRLSFGFVRDWSIGRWALQFLVPAALVAGIYFILPTVTFLDPRVKLVQPITLADRSVLWVLTVVDADGAHRLVKYPGLNNRDYSRAHNLPGAEVDRPPKISNSRGVGGYRNKFEDVMNLQREITPEAQAALLGMQHGTGGPRTESWHWAIFGAGVISFLVCCYWLWLYRDRANHQLTTTVPETEVDSESY